MPKFVKGSQEAKDHMANLRAMAKAKREELKNVSVVANDSEESNEKEHWTTSAFLKDTESETRESSEVEVEVVQTTEDEPPTKKTRAPRKKKIIIEEDPEQTPEQTVEEKVVKPKRQPKANKNATVMPPVNFETNPLLAPKVIRFH